MKKSEKLPQKSKTSGFTLIELLIVVIILAVLAAIVVPQFSTSTQEAREAALKSTLLEMRNAIELYYHQHNGKYPGHTIFTTGTGVSSNPDDFKYQLTLYTNVYGKGASTQNLTETPPIKLGPYLKATELPPNPIDGSNVVALTSYTDGGDLNEPASEPSSGTVGWWYDAKTGKFVANTPGQASDGSFYYKW